MIPQIYDTVDNTTETITLPSKTYKLNLNDSVKPSIFKILNYVDTDTYQYIDTGFTPNRPFKIVFSGYTLTYRGSGTLFGVTDHYNLGSDINFGPYGTAWKLNLNSVGNTGGEYVQNAPFLITYTYYTEDFDDETVFITQAEVPDDIIMDTNTEPTNINRNLYIFACNDYNSTRRGIKIRCYNVKIYLINDDTTETLIRDFVPALDNNNMACLFDRVNNSPFYSIGRESFIPGPETGEVIETGTKYTDTIAGYVDNLEAMKQAIYHILMTERYAYLIYSDNYGVELEQYIGQSFDYLETTIENTLKTALMYDLRITNVIVNSVTKVATDQALVKFTAYTIFGNLQMEVNISV